MADLHLLLNIGPGDASTVRAWVSKLPGRVAVLLQGYSDLHDCEWGAKAFSEFDIVPTSSDAEEEIYRYVSEFNRQFDESFADIRFLGVPLVKDLDNLVGSTPERHLSLSASVDHLLKQGFERVVVLLQHHSAFHFAFFREAIRQGIAAPRSRPLLMVDGELRPASGTYETESVVALEGRLRRLLVPSGSKEIAPLLKGMRREEPILLVLSSNPIFVRNAANVVRAARMRYPELPVFVDTRATIAALERAECPNARVVQPDGIYDVVNAAAAASAIVELFRRIEAYTNSVSSSMFSRWWAFASGRSKIAHDKKSSLLLALKRAVLQPELLGRFAEYCGFIENFTMLLDAQNPSAVFRIPSVGNFFDHAVLYLARDRSIPLVAASVMSFDARYRNLNRFDYDKLTVLGEEQAEIIRDLRMANEVIAVGQPDLDEAHWRWTPEASRSYVLERLKLTRSKQLVVVATSALALESELKWIVSLGEHARRRGDTDIVVKLHPSVSLSAYSAVVDKGSDWPVHLVTDWEILPYLVVADVVLTDASHAGKQAIYLGKPLISVNMTGVPFPYNRYGEEGVAALCESEGSLLAELDKCLDSESQRSARLPETRNAYIRRYMTANDGRASDRIVQILMRAAKDGVARREG